jgi:hypothetical protein
MFCPKYIPTWATLDVIQWFCGVDCKGFGWKKSCIILNSTYFFPLCFSCILCSSFSCLFIFKWLQKEKDTKLSQDKRYSRPYLLPLWWLVLSSLMTCILMLFYEFLSSFMLPGFMLRIGSINSGRIITPCAKLYKSTTFVRTRGCLSD